MARIQDNGANNVRITKDTAKIFITNPDNGKTHFIKISDFFNSPEIKKLLSTLDKSIYTADGAIEDNLREVTILEALRFISQAYPSLFALDGINGRVGINTIAPAYELHLAAGDQYIENGVMAIGATPPTAGYAMYIATDDSFGDDHRGQRIVLGGESSTAAANMSGLEIRTLNTKTAAGTNNYRFIDVNATGGATTGTYNLIGMRVKLDTFTDLGSATINRYIGEFRDGNQALGKVLADISGTGLTQWVDPNTLIDEPVPLEIAESTIAGYVDTVNGDDLDDGLTPSTPKKTLAAIKTAITSGRIYIFAGTYSEAVSFSNDTFSGENRTWYCATGVIINIQGTITDAGGGGSYHTINIEGNGDWRKIGAGSIIDTTTMASCYTNIEANKLEHFSTSGGTTDPIILSANEEDIINITADNIIYNGSLAGTEYFIKEEDVSFFKYGRIIEINAKSQAGSVFTDNAGFLNALPVAGGPGLDTVPSELYFNIRGTSLAAGVPFINSTADSQYCYINLEFSRLEDCDILMTNFNNDSLLTMKTTSAFSTPFLGNVDCNRGTITLDGITWDAQTGSNKIIVRTTAELVAKECRFKGNAGAVEALSATNEVDIYNSVITTASGNTLVTDTATTRLWNCAFDPGGTYAVATSGGAVAITMDQCIGSKVLDPNVTDTIGNYTANAAWAGLK